VILRIKPRLQKRIFIDGLLFLLGFYCLLISVPAQTKIAFIIPEKNSRSVDFAEKLKDSFSKDAKVLDISLSEAAFRAQNLDKPFNLSLGEAKNVGAAIGCDYFLLIKAENLRRASLSKGDFYESYAVIFTVGSRVGKLVFWKFGSFEAETAEDADKKLFASVESLAAEISGKLKNAGKSEFEKKVEPMFEKLPEDDSPAAKNFRPPLPYKRFRPDIHRACQPLRRRSDCRCRVRRR
jgi:hypothetical protein